MVSGQRTRVSWPLLLAALCLLSNALAVAALGTRARALNRLSARLHGKILARSSALAAALQRDRQELTSTMPQEKDGIQVRFLAQPHHRDLVGQEGANITDYVENVKESVQAAVAESRLAATNEGKDDGPNVLHVLLGAEWRIRKTVHDGQFSEDDFATLIAELDKLSTEHPTWVLAPGTMMFEISDSSFLYKIFPLLKSDTQRTLVVNCLPVSFEGKTHVVCKKDECDMLDYEKQKWGYKKLAKRGSFGTKPYTTIKFHGHDIKIGIDICLDSFQNRLAKAVRKNTIDIYLISADGGSITDKTAKNALANGALVFKVDVMQSLRPDQRVAVAGKDLVDGTLHFIEDFNRGTTGPDPALQPIVVFPPLSLPWKQTVSPPTIV